MNDSKPLERDKHGHRILSHGRGGYARGCHCKTCTAAGAGRNTGRMPAEAVRDIRVTVNLSAEELALIDQAAGTTARGQYMRELVMEGTAADLGLDPDSLDTAARPAPRRANSKQRKERQQS